MDCSVVNIPVTAFKFVSTNSATHVLLIRVNTIRQLSFDHKTTQFEEYAQLGAVGGFSDHAAGSTAGSPSRAAAMSANSS